MISLNVGYGEAIDKLTILRIKLKRIKDKKDLIRSQAFEICDKVFNGKLRKELILAYLNLYRVNRKLWDIEDELRRLDRFCFTEDGEPFPSDNIQSRYMLLARKVYKLNDERYRIKQSIDRLYGIEPTEVKSYRATNAV